jgi:hypothetical protein
MERHIPFGNVGKSIGGLVGLVLLLGFFVFFSIDKVLAPQPVWDFWSVTGTIGAVFCCAIIYLYPTVIAHNVSDRIKEIETIRERDGLYKDTGIPHKYFWIICIVNILFGFTGLVWLILFFWAHAPGTVIIPDLVAAKINEKNKPELEAKLEPELEVKLEPGLEVKLQEVKNLFEKGLLTEDEAAIRRKKIISEE